jgi:hypothetical protein
MLSVAATWSMPALAQHGERIRRIDVLMNLAADDPESQARLTTFVQSLQQLGLDRRPQRQHRNSLGCGGC